MATYVQARANEFQAASSHTITGIDLAVAEDSSLAESGYKPIQLCMCVTEPCDCEGKIIWTKPDDINGQERTDRSNRAGEGVMQFRINPEATVLVESVVRVKVTALQAHSRGLLQHAATRLGLSRGGGDCSCGAPLKLRRDASEYYYEGQHCAGGTLYDVWVGAEGTSTTFYFEEVGSC